MMKHSLLMNLLSQNITQSTSNTPSASNIRATPPSPQRYECDVMVVNKITIKFLFSLSASYMSAFSSDHQKKRRKHEFSADKSGRMHFLWLIGIWLAVEKSVFNVKTPLRWLINKTVSLLSGVSTNSATVLLSRSTRPTTIMVHKTKGNV